MPAAAFSWVEASQLEHWAGAGMQTFVALYVYIFQPPTHPEGSLLYWSIWGFLINPRDQFNNFVENLSMGSISMRCLHSRAICSLIAQCESSSPSTSLPLNLCGCALGSRQDTAVKACVVCVAAV